MQDLHDAWGERIRKERQSRGWTAKELGLRVGVSEATISRIETGRCPSDSLKWNLAGAFGLRMDLLFAYPAVVPDAPQPVPA